MSASPGPALKDNVGKKQLRKGPAPIASFEDLSDEVESPDEKQSVIRLPGIHEVPTTPSGGESEAESSMYTGISLIGTSQQQPPPAAVEEPEMAADATAASLAGPLTKLNPCTPRIDISRASSSSHHEDSKDSSPENHDKLGLFKEDGTLDLRSSTEELDFQDQNDPDVIKAKQEKSRPASPLVFVCDGNFDRQRKDSQTSEICLLSISGRTSRLSSIGSQGSEHSRVSTTSHLSVISGASRSTSPHKMLLETSFCGSKSNLSEAIHEPVLDMKDGDALEKVLLSRKHDPREAILAEGIKIESRSSSAPESRSKRTPIPKPPRASLTKNQNSVEPKTPAKNPETSEEKSTCKLVPGQIIKSEAGVEYTFIPLKGPLPPKSVTESTPVFNKTNVKKKVKEPIKSTNSKGGNAAASRAKSAPEPNKPAITKSALAQPKPQQSKSQEPEYIWIKLKPDYMYENGGTAAAEAKQQQPESVQKPDSLNLTTSNHTRSKSADIGGRILYQRDIAAKAELSRPSSALSKMEKHGVSPTLSKQSISSRHQPPSPPIPEKLTHSPSLSRRSSLFKSRETMSPDSSTPTGSYKKKTGLTTILKDAGDSLRDRSRSRSKSRERDWSPAMSSNESIENKNKKSVFLIFKQKKTPTKTRSAIGSTSSSETLGVLEGMANQEFVLREQHKSKLKYHENLLEGDSIIIPLHSPSESDHRSVCYTCGNIDEIERGKHDMENVKRQPSDEKPPVLETPDKPEKTLKHNTSTSSENIVFSTKLGSNEAIFTTKLPKKPHLIEHVQQESTDRSTVDSLSDASVVTVYRKGSQEDIPKSRSRTSLKDSSSSQNLKKSAKSSPEEINNEINQQMVCSIQSPEQTKMKNDQTEKVEKPQHSLSVEDSSNRTSVASTSNRNSMISSTPNEEETSGNSEPDSEVELINKRKRIEAALQKEKSEEEIPDDHERKTLVFQDESFDDDLPYIPTTLPQERSVAVPIVPIKQRSTMEMKMCPIDRPRSTTPINPSNIDDYCGETHPKIIKKRAASTSEKLKISLPREDTLERIQRLKSPRKSRTDPKAWHDFAEKGIPQAHQLNEKNGNSQSEEEPTPAPSQRKSSMEQIKQWINFEEIPEKHKAPKRIQTIPSRGHIEVPSEVMTHATETVVYNYVNPEECQCECHEVAQKVAAPQEEAEIPLLQEDYTGDDTVRNIHVNRSDPSSSGAKNKR